MTQNITLQGLICSHHDTAHRFTQSHLRLSWKHTASLDTVPPPDAAIITDSHQNVAVFGDGGLPNGRVALLVGQFGEPGTKERKRW